MSEVDNTAPKRRSSAGNRRRRKRATAAPAQDAVQQSSSAAPTATVTAEPEAAESVDRNIQRREQRRAAKARKPERKGVGRVVDTQRFSGVQGFYHDAMSEIRKVIWPTREQTINLTLLVIAVSVVIGAVLGGIDYVLLQVFEAIG